MPGKILRSSKRCAALIPRPPVVVLGIMILIVWHYHKKDLPLSRSSECGLGPGTLSGKPAHVETASRLN